MSKMKIEYEPKEVTEGMIVQLSATPPADGSKFQYTYRWKADAGSISGPSSTMGGADTRIVQWHTRGLEPGAYRINVSATLVDPPPEHMENIREAEASVMVAVHHRPLSASDLERMASGAREFARTLKSNIDGKMDSLTEQVSGIARGMDTLAQSGANGGNGQVPTLKVALQRSSLVPTADQALWPAIRHHTEMIGFNRYSEFINRVLCQGSDLDGGVPTGALEMGMPTIGDRREELLDRPTIHGVDSYELLRTATEVFLILECGIRIRHGELLDLTEEESRLGERPTLEGIVSRLQQYLGNTATLPYLTRVVTALMGPDPGRRDERLPYCDGILRRRFTCPTLIELIWSYWHEEGMLVQTLNAIALRFQNRHRGGDRDPLAHLAIDPLRPLNNLFWGYIQSEYKRLSVPRRAYEYDHHYGLTLYGKAVPQMRTADSRSKFLEAFHNLLYRAAVFFHEDADTTVVADGFPLLTALREVHLLLAEGAHNQFGDLPWTARVEMLIEQWLLSRPEIREFLRGRAMVPYKEPWMSQIDTMKKLQGWGDTSITHFRDLAVWGEQIVLSVRYGDWVDVNDQEHAKNWARYWRPEIQGYIHAYRAATGVDLSADSASDANNARRYLQPSVHLRNRLAEQQKRAGRP